MVFGSLGLGTATVPPPRGEDEEVPSPVSAASGRRLRADPLSLLLLDPRSEDILTAARFCTEAADCTGQPGNKAASFIKMNLFELLNALFGYTTVRYRWLDTPQRTATARRLSMPCVCV